MDHSKLVVVQVFSSRPEAELAKGLLDSEGIDSMLQIDNAGGMREHLAWSGAGFKLLVRDADLTSAREILSEVDSVPPESDSDTSA